MVVAVGVLVASAAAAWLALWLACLGLVSIAAFMLDLFSRSL